VPKGLHERREVLKEVTDVFVFVIETAQEPMKIACSN
jgi:hypothetical protein